MDVDGAMGIYFNEEIVVDILSRLPVRSLLRFKCVSKIWMALISEPYFTMKHLKLAKNNQNSPKILFLKDMFTSHLSSLTPASLPLAQFTENVQKLDWLYGSKPRNCKIYCCCDGLVLVGVRKYDNIIHLMILLWNPSTRESTVLRSTEFLPSEDYICGLGYDATSGDYMILKIGYQSCSEILALKSGSGRIIGKPTGIYRSWLSDMDSDMDSLTFIHGAFHWLGFSRDEFVTSYNISNEVFKEETISKWKVCGSGHELHQTRPFGKRVVKHSKKMDVDGTKEVHLQEEIIMDILSRLPVLSLLQFKCVLKCWMTLISEPYFTLKHLNRGKNNKHSQKILVLHGEFPLHCSSLSSASLSSVQLAEDVRKLDWPSNPRPWRFRMYCCYDGLVLIKLRDYPQYARAILLVWNPSTRESTVLPRTEFSLTKDYSFGLGYDSTSDDYKILKIDDAARCEILTLKSGSWRKIDKLPAGVFPVLSDTEDSLAFVHGAFHWLD
ncbi:hypothetical protein CQW23_31124 [Capsicum baccatum]|uniref:F-box domain-containing protein n=1 Tax=Capsicum baccatum TaxID=33114 RepID=A0A2G2V8D9_CAPBA|nr:hypothetical protein CQW23_31124 [Capsicum baccatum]